MLGVSHPKLSDALGFESRKQARTEAGFYFFFLFEWPSRYFWNLDK